MSGRTVLACRPDGLLGALPENTDRGDDHQKQPADEETLAHGSSPSSEPAGSRSRGGTLGIFRALSAGSPSGLRENVHVQFLRSVTLLPDRLDDINAAYADVEDAQPDVGGRRTGSPRVTSVNGLTEQGREDRPPSPARPAVCRRTRNSRNASPRDTE